jgi:hypothetical protein
VTGLLRCAFFIALALLLSTTARRPLLAEPPATFTIDGDQADTSADPPPNPQPPPAYNPEPPESAGEMVGSDSYFSKLQWLGLRHSSYSGRNAGLGFPLSGTSWLNRPYYLGGDIGTVWLTRPINNDLTTDIDTFGGVFAGCDWDYYWGTEFSINRATPEIINEKARRAERGDRLMEETLSLMYYPWGDSLFRPYWRVGVGAMAIDYPTDDGLRRDEQLWTFPVGIGLKYPFRRYLAARAEFTDQLALGNSGVATQHDLTLTFGLEWRFGAHPRSYWPWNPSRHIW